MYTGLLEDFGMVVKPPKCVVESIQQVFGNHVLMCNITEIKERRESLGDIDWNEAFQCYDKDLFELSTLGLVMLQKTDLHEHLGVVPSPLLEISPLFESTKARE